MAKNIAYDSPIKEFFWIYYPGKNWKLGIMTNNPIFEDERNVTQILPRTSYVYEAITTADNMVKNFIGSGSKYLMNYRDANDTLLVGSNSYKLNVPSNVLAEQFWSVDAYDNETRSLLKNDARSGNTSVNLENVTQNNDGSYEIYFGSGSLAGQNGNWIKTNADEGFFVIFRLYGSTEPYYDKGWQLPNIELVKGDIRIH
jgi:hypothetical protein